MATSRGSTVMDASAPWGLVDVRPIVARVGCGAVAVAAIAAEQEGLITIA